MGLGCCDGCIKYLLFAFNLIFSLSGLAILIVGSVLLSRVTDWDHLVSDTDAGSTAPQITLIVVGVFIFLVATLGCCGAIRENRCMLITFAILLLSIFIIELAIGIYAITNFSDLKDAIQKGLQKNFESYGSNQEITDGFDALQKSVECCGLNNYNDYPQMPGRGIPIPDSCCKDYKQGCATNQSPANFWQQGCVDALTDFTSDAGKILGGVAIGLSLIEIVGAIFALRLASTVK